MEWVLVTGGGRGIGAATSRLLAKAGYGVLINYAADRASAEALAAELPAARTVQGDVGREADVLAIFAAADALPGRLVGLVNNAGIVAGTARVENVTEATLQRILAVNVTGSFLCAREAVKRFAKSGGGAIVNVSSIAARLGGSGDYVHYAATKGAIDTFTIGLAREVAAQNIRVNAVAPGLIETEIHASSGNPDRATRLGPSVPIGRAGTAEEVAEAIVWLLSPAASYVVGAVLTVGGGR
jgi:NAD(P)-dependent dehydrogenase (short-subunit alcohol dehydrogenase family)